MIFDSDQLLYLNTIDEIMEIPIDACSSLNNILVQDNIMDFFVFDENENNIIENTNLNKRRDFNEEKDEQKIQVNYNICTFITSPIRPDLYCPSGVISGNKYKLILHHEKIKLEEEKYKKEDEEDITSPLSSIESYEDEEEKISEKKKIKIIRYFNIEPDISLKCQICGEIGHKKSSCQYQKIKFCYRCAKYGHESKDCDYFKCFKCNKIGHKTFFCPINERELIICEQCNCIGHKNEDCLICPKEIFQSYLIYNNFYCFYCGNPHHALCSLLDRELPELYKEEEKEIIIEKNDIYPIINLDIENDEEIINEYFLENSIKDNKTIKYENYSDIIFCGFCGGKHRNDECIFKEKFINRFEEIRKSAGKKLIEKRNEEFEKECLKMFNNNIINNSFNDSSFYTTNNDKDYEKSKIICLDEDDSSENDNDSYGKNNNFKFGERKKNKSYSIIANKKGHQFLGKKHNNKKKYRFFS